VEYNEQTDALAMELGSLITRYIKEFDLNIQTIVGVLEEQKFDLLEGGTMLFEIDEDSLSEDDDELLF
tara:strand:+ start:61 stop:264 length:204 start_codon:yes stop_codon:yes gene_type:complete